MGIGFAYYMDSKHAEQVRESFNNIDGESIVLRGVSASEVFGKMGYEVVKTSAGIYYGYSPRGKEFIKLGRDKINLQVVERNGSTVVGWPVILGVY
jgi:hypothetical protein